MVSIGQGGAIMGMGLHPKKDNIIIYSNDMGSSYRSDDFGKSYKFIGNIDGGHYDADGGMRKIVFWPKDPRVVISGGKRGVFRSDDDGETWRCISNWPGKPRPFFCMECDSLAVGPDNADIVFAGMGYKWNPDAKWCMDGIFRTLDGGKTWKQINSGIKIIGKSAKTGRDLYPHIKEIIIDPDSPKEMRTVYAATGDGFYISSDNGDTWKRSGTGLPHQICRALDYSYGPDGKMILALLLDTIDEEKDGKLFSKGGVYFSHDGAKTWEERNGDLRVGADDVPAAIKKTPGGNGILQKFYDLAVSRRNPDIIYVGTDYRSRTFGPWGLYKTSDGGKTWRFVTICKVWKAEKSRIRKSLQYEEGRTNMKMTFTKVLNDGEEIHISENNDDIVYFSDWLDTYRSVDGGQTWKDVANDEISPNRFKGRGNSNLCTAFVQFNPRNKKKVYLSSQDNGYFFSRDGGKTLNNIELKKFEDGRYDLSWNLLGGRPALFYDQDPDGKQDVIYAASGQWCSPSLFKSTDDGDNFKLISRIMDKKDAKKVHVMDLLIDPESPFDSRTIFLSIRRGQILVAGYSIPSPTPGFGVKVSRDGGKTWESKNNGFGENLNVSDLEINPDNPREIYAAVLKMKKNGKVINGGLFRTINGGDYWERVTPPDFENIGTVVLDRKDPGTIYVSRADSPSAGNPPLLSPYTGQDGIWKSVDGGKAWEQIFQSRGCTFVSISPLNPDYLLAGATTFPTHRYAYIPGVYFSRNGGETWTKVNRGLCTWAYNNAYFHPTDPSQVWLSTMGAGWYNGSIKARSN